MQEIIILQEGITEKDNTLFKNAFGRSLYSMYNKWFGFDVFRFDYMIGTPDGTSTRDYVKETKGEKVLALLEKILSYRPYDEMQTNNANAFCEGMWNKRQKIYKERIHDDGTVVMMLTDKTEAVFYPLSIGSDQNITHLPTGLSLPNFNHHPTCASLKKRIKEMGRENAEQWIDIAEKCKGGDDYFELVEAFKNYITGTGK